MSSRNLLLQCKTSPTWSVLSKPVRAMHNVYHTLVFSSQRSHWTCGPQTEYRAGPIETQVSRSAIERICELGPCLERRKYGKRCAVFESDDIRTVHSQCRTDDFRSIMHQANSSLKALQILARQSQSHSHSSSSAPSPSTSPSSSTLPNLATASEAEISRARIEPMNKLIDILQRNVRVRYELDVADVVHA